MSIRTFALSALLLATASCGQESATAVTSPAVNETATDTVLASRVDGGVRLTNEGTRPVAYAVWNPDWLALFGPCASTGPDCPRLAPGASVFVPDAAIDGLTDGSARAVVRWWHVIPDGAGGFRADVVHETFVTL
ncbi:MAG: hypothetical protein ACYC2G_05410 [Gemmatimonadaceae bacterium]